MEKAVSMSAGESGKKSDFIRAIVSEDISAGKNGGRVATRFPPEPNGFLHIGHAKSICLNFGVALENGGKCSLRFDDTNPGKESADFVESIKADVRWLGYDWEDRLRFASDHFDKLFECAVVLIKDGLAFVDDLSVEQMREYRGTLTEPGKNSPFRDRDVSENLSLFQAMKKGEFAPGEKVLRAKIDMSSPNINMRDPVIYRILKTPHHRTGDRWKIYPTYDFAHPLCDAIEGITHSFCTLEFEDHRPLYDWFVEKLSDMLQSRPSQTEFSRLELTRTVISKRKLSELVEGGFVNGWDDPRMPTLSAMRRRGYPPEAIRDFCEKIGVTKQQTVIETELLEHFVRERLNKTAMRRMAVFNPLKVVIVNYCEDEEEFLTAVNNPEDESAGEREIPFSRTLYVERDDFMENPPKKFFRLSPGAEVRLRYGYFVTCIDAVKNDKGEVCELRCRYDPETRGGYAPDGRKVRGTVHWVSARHAGRAEARFYDSLFEVENPLPAEGGDLKDMINPDSLRVLEDVRFEPSLKGAKPGEVFQFERKGYFAVDKDSVGGRTVFNETVPLRDSWKKFQTGNS